MTATKHGVYLLHPGEPLSMIQGIDNAPVGTTQNDHQARLHGDNKRLVIEEFIRRKACALSHQQVRLYHLKLRHHRNLTGSHYPIVYPYRLGTQPEVSTQAFQLVALMGDTDIVTLLAFAVTVFIRPDIGVGYYLYLLSHLTQHVNQTTSMVIVTVAQDNAADPAEVDTEKVSIVTGGDTLPRI